MPHPRVWLVVSFVCFLTALFVLAANPATTAPSVADGAYAICSDVIVVFEHWYEGGPRRAGQMLLLFSGLFLIHACICAWIRRNR